MPKWPMAMPSSMAMVLNSAAKQPSPSMCRFTRWPISCRCTCPGTNWVKELTTAMTGRLICSSLRPLARHRARAPAMCLPSVLVALRSFCFISAPLCSKIISFLKLSTKSRHTILGTAVRQQEISVRITATLNSTREFPTSNWLGAKACKWQGAMCPCR